MKFVKSKQIQKEKGRKKGKYLITLEVTDNDIEMFEDLYITMEPFKMKEKPTQKNNWNGIYLPEYTDKYNKWLNKTWKCFWKLWSVYD